MKVIEFRESVSSFSMARTASLRRCRLYLPRVRSTSPAAQHKLALTSGKGRSRRDRAGLKEDSGDDVLPEQDRQCRYLRLNEASYAIFRFLPFL